MTGGSHTRYRTQVGHSKFPIIHCLQFRLDEVALEVAILERHVRRAEVRVLKRGTRRIREALPGDQGLLAADGRREAELVVDRPDAVVLNERARAGERGRGRRREAAVSGGGRPEDRRLVLARVVDPNDDALPVVAVAEAVRGLVLRDGRYDVVRTERVTRLTLGMYHAYMIAYASLYDSARAYTWPVLDEHPPFVEPVGARPPLRGIVFQPV